MNINTLGLDLTAAWSAGSSAWSHPAGGEHFGGHMFSGLWHGGWTSPLMMALMLGIAVTAMILVVRWLSSFRREAEATAQETNALDILKARFARGELDGDAFEEARRVLRE